MEKGAGGHTKAAEQQRGTPALPRTQPSLGPEIGGSRSEGRRCPDDGFGTTGLLFLGAKRDADLESQTFQSGRGCQLSICLLPSPHRATPQGDRGLCPSVRSSCSPPCTGTWEEALELREGWHVVGVWVGSPHPPSFEGVCPGLPTGTAARDTDDLLDRRARHRIHRSGCGHSPTRHLGTPWPAPRRTGVGGSRLLLPPSCLP